MVCSSTYKTIAMNRTSKIIGGIVLLAFGIVWALELMNVIHISFEGWWTLFIIVPCFVNIFNDQHKAGSVIGFGIGILCYDIFLPLFDLAMLIRHAVRKKKEIKW